MQGTCDHMLSLGCFNSGFLAFFVYGPSDNILTDTFKEIEMFLGFASFLDTNCWGTMVSIHSGMSSSTIILQLLCWEYLS